ncbi:uncharacterized protein LOC105748836 [Orcinus orca]|uniref:uncharacterized protein LOC105748836 n=1 Tax=Orcinus orca TaxID=9733 RepID=UPI0021120613|nr:uncharacterized protein LOC105748836 [Orcinus orca]
MARHLLGFHADSEGMATSTPGHASLARVLPTAAGSYIVAVNALLLSPSPLKICEHAGLGCVRQSLPRMVGSRGCGSDRFTHWG